MTRLLAFLALLTASAGDLLPCSAQEVSFRDVLSKIAPKTPEESLACLQVWDGFQVELVCAEPMVRDPIALDWGPDGKLWVVEMGDYPRGEPVGTSGGGRIKCLVDATGDGKPDRATVFLDGLAYPTGVMAWGRGVLITCAPRILYAEDMDGDGRADRRDVLFEGFSQGNPQHQVNGLRWGLDNWIYGANGDNGGFVTSTKTGERLDIHARDFRIRPETGEIQTQTGMAQFGRCRDDWGNWFGGRNLEPIWHCVLDDQYLRRNPYLVPPNPCVSLLDPPTCARVYPISEMLPRFNEPWTMNRFTASCGNAVYRDSLFGPAFANSFFVCEPAYNLVYCGVLHRRGVTFSGQRHADRPEQEFLASRDHWFRPTQVRTGPDGALWVVDMYRLVIEHPDYIPAKWHDQLDFRAGADKGRIYRVFPSGTRPRTFTPLHDLTTARLVESLDDANGPRRDMVQQLLVRRRDKSAVVPLSQLVSDSDSPKCRLSALCTLDGLGSVPVPVLVHALSDPHAAVRRQAIRIAEPLMDGSSAIQEAVLSLLDDADPQVRMQLAYSLGQWNNRRAGEALAALALRDADDPFLIAAIMSSATLYPGEILERMIAEREVNAAQTAMIENLVRLVFESGQEDVLARALARIATEGGAQPPSWRYQVLAGFLDVLAYRGSSLSQWHQQGSPETRAASEAMDRMIAAARRAAFDPEVPPTVRVPAVRLVGRGLQRSPEDVTLLSSLLVPQTAVELQRAAVDALRAVRPANLPDILLEHWEQHGPELRPQIMGHLLDDADWTMILLDRLETGQIVVNEIGAAYRSQLILHGSADVRRRAAKILGPSTPQERLDAIARYQASRDTAGDAARGRTVFREHCSSCHRLDGEGTDVGSDLLALTDRSRETLLLSILDPNRAVQPRFVEYSVVTIDGHVLSGIVASETGNSITLIDPHGKEHKLLRADVDEFVSSGRSMMPDGVEKLLAKPEDLWHVIAYLQAVGEEVPQRPNRGS